MNPKDLKVIVKQIKGSCPVYKENDNFFIKEGFKLITEKPICMHSLASIIPYYVALSRGTNPIEIGLSKDENVAYLQCPDPHECTGGGTVIFEIFVCEL